MEDPDSKLISFLKEEKSYLEDLRKIDLDKNWERFQESLNAKSSHLPEYPFRNNSRFIFRAAAAVLLLLLVATTLYFTSFHPSSQLIQARAESGYMDLKLSDGTAIYLNEGAVIHYPQKLKRRAREVTLSGEAFFEVAPSKNSRFYVFIADMTVRVLGTSFNIKQYASGNVEISVTEGEVLAYESGNKEAAIRITAGQQAIYNIENLLFETKETASENFLFWKTGTLVYKDTPLLNVFEELELQFNRKIIVEDPEILENRWNSTHRDQELSDILEEFCLYFDHLNLEWIERNDTILIQRKDP